MSIEGSKKRKPGKRMPLVLDADLARSAHFNVRERHPVTRRLRYRDFPIRDFRLQRFDETYEIARKFNNYLGRKNRIGWLWLATTRQSVEFESALERTVLLELDQDPNVTGIWTQPFRLEGIDKKRSDKVIRTYPDFLVQLTDESLMVVQVKPRRKLLEPEHPATTDAEALRYYGRKHRAWEKFIANCAWEKRTLARIGWGHQVLSEPHPLVARNLRYMQVYRRPLSPDDPVSEKVLERADTLQELSFGELAEYAGGHNIAAPVILHHVWHNRLLIDWTQPLSKHTGVQSANYAATAVAA